MKSQVHQVLTSQVGVPAETAECIAILPTTGDPDELLPTDTEWCFILLSALLAAPIQTNQRSNSDQQQITLTNLQQ